MEDAMHTKLDAELRPAPVLQAVEKAIAHGADPRVIIIVDLGGLATLSLPARGSVDFMVRGASAEELSIRARHLLWPGEEAASDDIVRIESLTLNLATYQAYIAGEPIDFAYLEYALFAFLVTHPGRTYSREVLLSRVWGVDYFGGSRTVDVHVRRVRAKLGPELARRLETVRNVGYLWNG